MYIIDRTFLLASVFVLSACGGSSKPEEPIFDFCGEGAKLEPVITISSAIDSAASIPISEIVISDVAIEGTQVSVDALRTLATGLQISGDTLVCQVPCSFGLTEGNYSMLVTAAGYKPSNIAFFASYSSVVGDCVKTYSGSKRVTIALEPS